MPVADRALLPEAPTDEPDAPSMTMPTAVGFTVPSSFLYGPWPTKKVTSVKVTVPPPNVTVPWISTKSPIRMVPDPETRTYGAAAVPTWVPSKRIAIDVPPTSIVSSTVPPVELYFTPTVMVPANGAAAPVTVPVKVPATPPPATMNAPWPLVIDRASPPAPAPLLGVRLTTTFARPMRVTGVGWDRRRASVAPPVRRSRSASAFALTRVRTSLGTEVTTAPPPKPFHAVPRPPRLRKSRAPVGVPSSRSGRPSPSTSVRATERPAGVAGDAETGVPAPSPPQSVPVNFWLRWMTAGPPATATTRSRKPSPSRSAAAAPRASAELATVVTAAKPCQIVPVAVSTPRLR